MSCFQHPMVSSSVTGVAARAACNQAALQTSASKPLITASGDGLDFTWLVWRSVLRAGNHTSDL